MNSYAYITNPETGRKVNVFGKTGQKIIKNYYIQAGGSGVPVPVPAAVPPAPVVPVSNKPGVGEQLSKGVETMQKNWADGAPARAKAAEDTRKAMANAAQSAKNAWGDASKATGAFFGNVRDEAQWQMLRGTWAGNDQLWKKMTPEERCYLSALQTNDCQENPYFEPRTAEIVSHLTTAHQVLTQYYTQKATFDAEDTALSMKPVSAPPTEAEKKKVAAQRDMINKLIPVFKTSVSRAESKLRRLPEAKLESLKEFLFNPQTTPFTGYPSEVGAGVWKIELDTTLKQVKLTSPANLTKVACKACAPKKKFGLFGGKGRNPGHSKRPGCSKKPGCSKRPGCSKNKRRKSPKII